MKLCCFCPLALLLSISPRQSQARERRRPGLPQPRVQLPGRGCGVLCVVSGVEGFLTCGAAEELVALPEQR